LTGSDAAQTNQQGKEWQLLHSLIGHRESNKGNFRQ
jgi:hypothetical protein